MNAFNWRDTPSEIGATMPDSFRKPNLNPKRLHVYAEAGISDAQREADQAGPATVPDGEQPDAERAEQYPGDLGGARPLAQDGGGKQHGEQRLGLEYQRG